MRYQSRIRQHKHRPILGDDDISWFPEFARQCYRTLKTNSHIYIFCNDYAIWDYRRFLAQAGFRLKRTLVWVKNNHTMGDLRGDYGSKTEFVLFAHKGRRHLNGNRDTNVLAFRRVACNDHPTQKPVDLFAYLIRKSTSHGDLVLDPFLGSGTTVLAAKQTGRCSIGIEKDIRYIKVARRLLSQAR
jgi:DNA modification methylase